MVRELHVYGSAVAVHARDQDKFQHQGFGRLLMEAAERIAADEHCSTKIAVISGVGTRHYYRKLGYQLEGPYMVKYLATSPTVVAASPAACAAAAAPTAVAPKGNNAAAAAALRARRAAYTAARIAAVVH